MCLCSRNQGQAANLSVSHSGGKKKHSVCNMGGIQSNISGFAATIQLVYSGKWVYWRQKHTNSLSIDSNIRCSTLCPRNHEESIVMKLKNCAEVERSAFKVNQSHVLQFCRYEMREHPVNCQSVNVHISLSRLPPLRTLSLTADLQ